MAFYTLMDIPVFLFPTFEYLAFKFFEAIRTWVPAGKMEVPPGCSPDPGLRAHWAHAVM